MRFGHELNVRGLGHPRAEARGERRSVPDILMVPLAAFDRRGHRIGYGAGYYDMTLTRLRTLKPRRHHRAGLCGPGGGRGSPSMPTTRGSILC